MLQFGIFFILFVFSFSPSSPLLLFEPPLIRISPSSLWTTLDLDLSFFSSNHALSPYSLLLCRINYRLSVSLLLSSPISKPHPISPLSLLFSSGLDFNSKTSPSSLWIFQLQLTPRSKTQVHPKFGLHLPLVSLCLSLCDFGLVKIALWICCYFDCFYLRLCLN